ncbi:transcription antitermination factor NusB [uncultured Brachybacterium sp.]|uniref:transcription antitermination factor NusB n=1 Tax=uncultured Brachybacterium sp. TaxID=189680 RepID=UPI002629576C|nr:transcription antitermination factor NusB [uncultured Brachybacterium sp.]
MTSGSARDESSAPEDAGAPEIRRVPGLPHPTREGAEVTFERTVPAPSDRLHSRSRDRIRAIDVLFEADAKQREVLGVLQERLRRTAAQTPLPQRSRELVELYAPNAVDIDEDLATHSRDWPLHRMPAVDRAILRLGSAELLYGEDESGRGAIIGEYTKIAEVLSTDDSPRFVNGLLQRLVEVRGLLS